jgi:hypothetical protein
MLPPIKMDEPNRVRDIVKRGGPLGGPGHIHGRECFPQRPPVRGRELEGRRRQGREMIKKGGTLGWSLDAPGFWSSNDKSFPIETGMSEDLTMKVKSSLIRPTMIALWC